MEPTTITISNNIIMIGIGIVLLAIGIGIGYVVFSAPVSANAAANITKGAADSGNFSINGSKLNAQVDAINRYYALVGNSVKFTVNSMKIDSEGLIEVNASNSIGNTSILYFTKAYNFVSAPPFDIANYTANAEAQMNATKAANATANKTNATAAPAQNMTKTDRPKVELYVMSYCPYGTQAEKGILPVAEALKNKMDFSLKFVYYAMHGKKEIDENTRQYCIQKEQNGKFIAYLACFLNGSDASGCIAKAGVNSASLDSCMSATDTAYNITGMYNDSSTWLSGRYPRYPIYANENQLYGVKGSPTLVINGVQVSSGRAPAAFLNTICNAFTSKPAECSTSLSSVTPSAGFGYTNAGDSGAAAQCG